MPTRFNHLQLKLLLLLLAWLLTINTVVHAQQNEKCGSTLSYQQLMNWPDTALANRYREIDQSTKDYIQNLRNQRNAGMSDSRTTPVIIPVVVHVLYNTPAQNISLAQIQSQIDVLNRDFRKMNSDIGLVPGVFSPLATDCLIEFRLAVRGPDCMPTTGVTRTSTPLTEFMKGSSRTAMSSNPIKFTSAGGHDAWPRDKYLNIWVGNLAGSLLGYSSFPGDPANVDGVAIDYAAFGTIGTATAPFHKGRSATHEIGHWLNVFHIWGDDGVGCDGTDLVDDTPNQGGPNSGCPSFPHISCGNTPNGDMFMNYMDYTDDPCMFMFTIGQSERMDAALYGFRSPILSSDAMVPSSGPGDLYMQDLPDDDGTEPYSTASAQSQDIWVRRQDDGFTNQENESPLYRPASSLMPNYVYVKVRNRGCSGGPMSGNLKLYWSKASSGLAWPSAWDGSITTPALMGGRIGPAEPVSVAPGGYQIIKFAWYPANPADYLAFTGHADEPGHFCLLARIETSTVAPYGMTYPEEVDMDHNHYYLRENVRRNNNIAWKNITVSTETTGGITISTLVLGHYIGYTFISKVYFKTPVNSHQQHFLKYGNIVIRLGTQLYNKWKQGGKKSFGVIERSDSSLLITNNAAWIDSLKFNPSELLGMKVEFQYAKKIPFTDARKLDFVIEQAGYDSVGQESNIGTETYHIKSLSVEPNINRIRVKLRGLLEGTYRSEIALMLDSLRTKGIIPIATPYQAPQFARVNNPVLEVIDPAVLQVSGTQAITDWVWIELRDSLDNKKILSTRSALIRRDGDIVDLDGKSPVSFRSLPNGGYYIVLRHRNHLGIMTAGTIHLTGNDTASIDFTKPTTPTYGNKAQRSIGNIMAMWAGNANGDGTVKYNGASNDKTFILSRVGLTTPNKILVMYDAADTNLDGTIKYNGAGNDKNVVLSAVGLSTSNNIIVQQLP